MTHLLLFSANFGFIFLKAFQSRNVAHLHYWSVVPLSLLLAMSEVFMISTIAILGIQSTLDWHHVVALAIGGGIGCMLSMYTHDKIHTRKGEE